MKTEKKNIVSEWANNDKIFLVKGNEGSFGLEYADSVGQGFIKEVELTPEEIGIICECLVGYEEEHIKGGRDSETIKNLLKKLSEVCK